MTAIDNIINQIEGETQNRGNTKTRIAAVLRLLRDKIVGLFSTKLDKGSYTGTADDLRTSIDGKVDKVTGKGLSTNDYTNQEKQTNQTNAQKRVVGVTVTGDVTKILTLTLADSSVLQASFTDKDTLPNNLADVKLNSLNFNHDTGVLTGVRSDGQQLTVNLDGRYAMLGHTHDDRYSRLGHTHSEYAYHTHRHNWDDIDGKPALATGAKIQEEIRKIQVGGRNYVLKSNDRHNSLVKSYPISQEFIKNIRKGDSVVVSLFIKFTKLVSLGVNSRIGAEFTIHYVDNTKDYVWAWLNFSSSDIGKGYKGRFSFVNQINPNKEILRITDNIGLHVQCEVEGLSIGMPKLEIGNTPTDWSPAPEDLLVTNNARANSSITLTHAHNNTTIFLEGITGVDMTGLEDLDSVSFRKCFRTGHVNFTTTNGKQIVYTGDSRNMQEGGEGSTAVVSVYGNKIYVDIRNV